jgi:hypothetical protein
MIATRSLLLIGLMTIIALNEEPATAAERSDVYREILEGRKLTPSATQQLEAALQQTPNDISLRTKLLGYYTGKQFSSASDRAVLFDWRGITAM